MEPSTDNTDKRFGAERITKSPDRLIEEYADHLFYDDRTIGRRAYTKLHAAILKASAESAAVFVKG